MDERDKRLCRLAMEIQYKCQQFFFGEMAFNYFADQNKEFVQRRRTTYWLRRYLSAFNNAHASMALYSLIQIFNYDRKVF